MRSKKRKLNSPKGHPLGVQPLGNFYAFSDQSHLGPHFLRNRGLGSLAVLEDRILIGVLGLLPARDLMSVTSVSKSLYLFSSFEELWRFLVLEERGGDFSYHESGSWKATYLNRCIKSTERVVVSDFYSDYMFQYWINCCGPFLPHWLERCTVERRDSSLSAEMFIKEFETPGVPVVISNALRDWKGIGEYDLDTLDGICGDSEFRVQTVSMKYRDFNRYCKYSCDETPLYLFDHEFVEKSSVLGLSYQVPLYFPEDLFSLLPNRPRYRWLIAGPARSGSTFHKDPNGTSAWNAVVSGRKKWIFFPPSVVPPGVYVSPDQSEVGAPSSTFEWFSKFYDDALEGDVAPLECITETGDLVFVPSGWWHMVVNLEDSVAITQNYVSSRNLKKVLSFLKTKGDQVSGVCEGTDLYSEFTERLKENGLMPDEDEERPSLFGITSSFSFLS